ncbi:MAG TPA: hypothetical protein VMO26_08715 [Vicinamibacterales bacterium]|nr:hypothetical protein [Vicinamibacterales bacterium]
MPVPDPERAPRPPSTEQADLYRALLAKESPPPATQKRRGARGGLLGLTALGLAGWAWRSTRTNRKTPS